MAEFHKDVPAKSRVFSMAGEACRPRSTERIVDHAAEAALRVAMGDARRALLTHRTASGAWSGPTSASALAAARYLLALCWLDRQHGFSSVEPTRAWLRENALPSGGWSRVEGGGFDLDATASAYMALRALGDAPRDPLLDRARQAMEQRGGLVGCEPVTCYLLAACGQVDYRRCLPLPPETLLLPRWAPGNPWCQADWTLSLLVPLAVLWAQRPIKFILPGDELGPLWRHDTTPRQASHRGRESVDLAAMSEPGDRAWSWFSRGVATVITGLCRLHVAPVRRAGLASAEQWLQDRVTAAHGLNGSLDATVLTTMALLSRGHARGSGSLRDATDALEQFRCGQTAGAVYAVLPRSVPATATALRALAAGAEMPADDGSSEAIRPGLEWVLRAENAQAPAARRDRPPESGGWSPHRVSGGPSETVSTAAVLLTLRRQFAENPPSSLVTDDSMMAMIRANSLNLAHRQIAVLDRVAAASRRARHWLLSMQNSDGGWGYTTRHANSRSCLIHRLAHSLPRSDHSTPYATGFVLQALGAWELGCGQSAVDKAVAYLRSRQQDNGSWADGHDAGAIATCGSVVEGLRSVGLARRDETIRRAADWLLEQQQGDGGWRENPAAASSSTSYAEIRVADDLDGAPLQKSCPLATARSLLALLAAGERGHPSVARGVDFLLHCQSAQGHWTAAVEIAMAMPKNPHLVAPTVAVVTAEVVLSLTSYARTRSRDAR